MPDRYLHCDLQRDIQTPPPRKSSATIYSGRSFRSGRRIEHGQEVHRTYQYRLADLLAAATSQLGLPPLAHEEAAALLSNAPRNSSSPPYPRQEESRLLRQVRRWRHPGRSESVSHVSSRSWRAEHPSVGAGAFCVCTTRLAPVVVHVDDPGLGDDGLDDLVQVWRGRQAGADVEKLAEPEIGREVAANASHEIPVGAHGLREVGSVHRDSGGIAIGLKTRSPTAAGSYGGSWRPTRRPSSTTGEASARYPEWIGQWPRRRRSQSGTRQARLAPSFGLDVLSEPRPF